MRKYFLQSDRILFSNWTENDLDLAKSIWGNPDVTRNICLTGVFTKKEIEDRLALEIDNLKKFSVQYYPIFDKESGDLIGALGLRPFDNNSYELGAHLRKKYWGKGYALEGAKAIIDYAFNTLKAKEIYAGHHPNNKGSRALIPKIGFSFIGLIYYEPTGLNHPWYIYKERLEND